MGRVRGRAEETGRARGMQGSSGGASSLLYSAAVTVRFFDAVALALFARELKERRSRNFVSATAAAEARASARPGRAGNTPSWALANQLSSNTDFRLAVQTNVLFFVAVRVRRPAKF